MALVVPPSSFWSGIDGSWTTFTLNIGNPPQAVNVFVSTSEPIPYVVYSGACGQNSTCKSARGGLYDPSMSNSFDFAGFYYLDIEQDLEYEQGQKDNGEFGYDTISVGYEGSGLPTLGNQTFASINTERFYVGLWGILPLPFNISNYKSPIPSFLQVLKDKAEIPSLSWGYTAGARYQLNGVLGSFTLSGYDSSKFEPNDVSFPMNPIDTMYLSVNVQNIDIQGTSSSTGNALSSSITMIIDSTLPFIWLPEDACSAFEDAFNLTYDEDQGLYLLSASAHSALKSLSPQPSVTFTLSTSSSGGDVVNITLPYDAFDLTGTPPFTTNTTLYFPLKRSQNQSQYVLGRTFLQEAYVIADFERQNFSVSQSLFEFGAKSNIVTIDAPTDSSNITVTPQPSSSSGSSGISSGAIAGIVVGVIAILVIGALLLFFCWWKPRKQRGRHEAIKENGGITHMTGTSAPPPGPDEQAPPYSAYAQHRQDMVEMDGAALPNTTKDRGELDASPERDNTPEYAGFYSPRNDDGTKSPLSEMEGQPIAELPERNSAFMGSSTDKDSRPMSERQPSDYELPPGATAVPRTGVNREMSDARASSGVLEGVDEGGPPPEAPPLPVGEGTSTTASLSHLISPRTDDGSGTWLASPIEEREGSGTGISPPTSGVVSPVLSAKGGKTAGEK